MLYRWMRLSLQEEVIQKHQQNKNSKLHYMERKCDVCFSCFFLFSFFHNRNPVGRTGIAGRGLFGRWGPNHAAHLVATR